MSLLSFLLRVYRDFGQLPGAALLRADRRRHFDMSENTALLPRGNREARRWGYPLNRIIMFIYLPENQNTRQSPRKYLRRAWRLLVLVGLPFAGMAQTQYHKIETEDFILHIREWGLEDGLPHWNISGLFQDSRGYIWMQTGYYFTRFDGDQFKIVAKPEEKLYDKTASGLFSRTDIDEDVHHNIWRWSYFNDRIVQIYDPAGDNSYSLQEYLGTDKLPALPPDCRMISMDQQIYLISDETGVIWRYDGKALRLVFKDEYRYEGNNANSTSAIKQYFPAPDNHFWIIHREMGLLLSDERGNTIQRYAALKQATYGFFIATGNKMYYYPRNWEANQCYPVFQAGGPAEPLAALPPGHREYERESFLGQFHPSDYQLTIPKKPEGRVELIDGHNPPQNLVGLVAQSLNAKFKTHEQVFYGQTGIPGQTRDGSFWMNAGRGLIQVVYTPKYFKRIFQGRSFRSLAWLDQDRFLGVNYYLGRQQLNVFHLQEEKVTPSILPNLEPAYSITQHAGETWLGIENGTLEQYDATNRLVARYEPPANANLKEARNLTFPREGQAWYGSTRALLELDFATGQSRYLLQNVTTYCQYKDRRGEHWVGTSQGLYQASTGKMYLDSLPSGESIAIRYIYEASDGSFWLATQWGLVRWKPFSKRIEHFTKADGLSNEVLHAVYPGPDAWLWLSSNHGIMAFNTQTHEVRSYFEGDGLANNEQNFLAHGYHPNGQLYFGGIDGLTFFNPQHIPPVDKSVQVFIDRITYLKKGKISTAHQGTVSGFTQPLYLPAGAQEILIDVSIPNLNPKHSFAVRWRIKRISPGWSPLNDDRRVQIIGLPSGKYDLEVQAEYKGCNKSTHTLLIPFRKAYFFYQTPWFWLLAAVSAVFAILQIIRLRERSLTAKNLWLKQIVQERTQELELSRANILRQKEHLERIDTTKTQLFNNISHEFRTPLTLIQGYTERLLTRTSNDMEVRRQVANIKQQSLALNKMIEEIMDLSRLQLGVIQLKKEPVEWTSFLRREFYLFQSQAQGRQLDYQLRIEPNEMVYLAIDKQKIERILKNLIGNAIKFTPAAGRILVYCTIRDEQVELVVADTGPGISQEEQPHIFDRHFQGSASRQTAQPGFGIGLALCQEYAKLMDGKLWVESDLGKGASFFLVFPKELALFQQAPIQERTAGEAQPRTFAHLLNTQEKRHLLIVEDNEQVLAFLLEVLSEDYAISTALNGEEALAKLEREPDIDLILSDLMMPVMDGFTLLERTRSHPVLGFIPFLLLTALTADESKLKALRLGVDAFLTKPFEIIELKAQIRNLIRNQELRKAYLAQMPTGTSPKKALTNEAPAPTTANQDEQDSKNSYNEQWMNELQAIILKNMERTDFKVTDLAFEMHVSERTLRNYIELYTGLAPSEFLQKARLDRAYQLAKSKKYRTISEIAYAVGFKDAKHFSKLFRKEFGKSPNDNF